VLREISQNRAKIYRNCFLREQLCCRPVPGSPTAFLIAAIAALYEAVADPVVGQALAQRAPMPLAGRLGVPERLGRRAARGGRRRRHDIREPARVVGHLRVHPRSVGASAAVAVARHAVEHPTPLGFLVRPKSVSDRTHEICYISYGFATHLILL